MVVFDSIAFSTFCCLPASRSVRAKEQNFIAFHFISIQMAETFPFRRRVGGNLKSNYNVSIHTCRNTQEQVRNSAKRTAA